MQVGITGSTGFLGNNLVRQLMALPDYQVVALIRAQSNRDPLAGLDLETREVDFTDPHSISHALKGLDAIVHSAALIQLGWSRLEESRQVNVGFTQQIALAARRQGIRMVLVSSVDALGLGSVEKPADENTLDPPNIACSYVVSKREAETAFLIEVADGLDGVIVNPGFMVGPYDWRPSSGEMMLSVYRAPMLFAPAGGASVVDVRDVAEGIRSAIVHGRSGQRYILGGHNLTYLELWQRMASIMGCSAPRHRLPDWMARAAGRVGDWMSGLSRQEWVVNSAATHMGQCFHWYTSEKAERELGYQIGSLEDALADAWDWFVAHEYVKPRRSSRTKS